MKDRWEYIPYENVGPIKFGMTKEQVKKILGEPKKTIMTRYKKLEEIRSNTIITYTRDTILVDEISCLFDQDIYFNGINVQDKTQMLRLLKNFQTSDLYQYYGIIFSLELGLAITGIHDVEQYSITFFNKETWLPFLKDASVFSFSKT
jgi:hypothetical protein